MILYWFLFFVFIVALQLNFKKTVLVYAPLKLIFHKAILLSVASPQIQFDVAANIFIFIFFIFKWKKSGESKFPLKWSFIISFAAILTTAFLASYFNPSMLIQHILSDFIFVYVFWNILKTEDDIKTIVKTYIYVIIFICFWAVIEFIFDFNPILDYMKANSPEGYVSDVLGERLGRQRVSGLMPHATTLGAVCAIFISFIVYYHLKYSNYIKTNKIIVYLVIILALGGVFLSSTRSSIVCLFIGLLYLVSFRMLFNVKGIIMLLFIAVILFLNYEYVSTMVDSILGSSKEVEGSSVEMRESQLFVVLAYFFQSPIWGNGYGFIGSLIGFEKDLRGAESIWFRIIGEEGILGVIAYLSLFINSIVAFGKKGMKSFTIYFTLAWLILNTTTSLPGLNISYYFCLLIIMYKTFNINQFKIDITNKEDNLINRP